MADHDTFPDPKDCLDALTMALLRRNAPLTPVAVMWYSDATPTRVLSYSLHVGCIYRQDNSVDLEPGDVVVLGSFEGPNTLCTACGQLLEDT